VARSGGNRRDGTISATPSRSKSTAGVTTRALPVPLTCDTVPIKPCG
jgi:hypothetical protein